MPKPVTVFDPVVRLRADMSREDISEYYIPPHFTNIQHALQMGRQFLSTQDTVNRQIILITDGLPTAHFEGQHLYLLYPPDASTETATMREGHRCQRKPPETDSLGRQRQEPESRAEGPRLCPYWRFDALFECRQRLHATLRVCSSERLVRNSRTSAQATAQVPRQEIRRQIGGYHVIMVGATQAGAPIERGRDTR